MDLGRIVARSIEASRVIDPLDRPRTEDHGHATAYGRRVSGYEQLPSKRRDRRKIRKRTKDDPSVSFPFSFRSL